MTDDAKRITMSPPSTGARVYLTENEDGSGYVLEIKGKAGIEDMNILSGVDTREKDGLIIARMTLSIRTGFSLETALRMMRAHRAKENRS